mgnify:CR=1 FL=1
MAGITQTLDQWAKQLGVGAAALRFRLYAGMPVELALTTKRMTSSVPWHKQLGQVVAEDFAAFEGTGGGPLTQDIPEIEFFK